MADFGRIASQSEFHDDDVTIELDGAETISAFLARRKQLSFADRWIVVDEAIRLLEGLYVHLPVKRAMYAVDPVRRLRLLKLRVERHIELQERIASRSPPGKCKPQPPDDDLWFHREMVDTLTSMRDLHTMYVLPEPFDRAIAFVPFQIERHFEGGTPRYIVSNVIDGLDWFPDSQALPRGVEVTHWNDVPMPRAVELAGARSPGSNLDARLARGLTRLAIRPLNKALPPEEECVTLRYQGGPDGHGSADRPLRVPWRVVVLSKADAIPRDGMTLHDMAEGLDYETENIRKLNKRFFSPLQPETDKAWTPRLAPGKLPDDKGITAIKPFHADTLMRDVVQAKTFMFCQNEYSYIRLRTFKVDPDLLLEHFVFLANAMPGRGMIIDIRDNPGGYILAGERLLQLFTPNAIVPEPAQLINTPLSLQLCEALDDFGPWKDSVRRAVETGTTFSSGYPLSDAARCNDIGQRYYGPVVLITNALCYSTADIFAAGFQDHGIGQVLGTDGSTGAGGANVTTHSALREKFKAQEAAAKRAGTPPPKCPLTELPACDLRFAIRRTSRVGALAGTELEDLGVRPDIFYQMTEDDVLNHNPGLLRKAAESLRDEPRFGLREVGDVVKGDGAEVVAMVETLNLDRLDISIDDAWNSLSIRVEDGVGNRVVAALPPDGKASHLRLRGYKGGKLAAARKIRLPSL